MNKASKSITRMVRNGLYVLIAAIIAVTAVPVSASASGTTASIDGWQGPVLTFTNVNEYEIWEFDDWITTWGSADYAQQLERFGLNSRQIADLTDEGASITGIFHASEPVTITIGNGEFGLFSIEAAYPSAAHEAAVVSNLTTHWVDEYDGMYFWAPGSYSTFTMPGVYALVYRGSPAQVMPSAIIIVLGGVDAAPAPTPPPIR